MKPTPDAMHEVLTQLQKGVVSVDEAVSLLVEPTSIATDDACVDIDRQSRCGFPEVVYGEGKPVESIVAIFKTLIRHNQDCLATRVSSEQVRELIAIFPNAIHNDIAGTIRIETVPRVPQLANVFVVAAGTTDRAVAEEAVETLRWMQVPVELIIDVGVAGPDRLRQQVHRFHNAAAVVVVAGMEGALPSVVAGHVRCPVVAVPTSVGYGASLGGISALLSMLNSCASNVSVVNIDAGFKGGYVAGLIASGVSSAGNPQNE